MSDAALSVPPVQSGYYRVVKVRSIYGVSMDSLAMRVGAGRLVSYTPARELPWRVVFEDEGAAGYCYACDGDRATLHDDFDVTVMDAMLVYNVDAMQREEDGERERLLTIEWSRDGQRSALRLDGVPQVLVDFQRRESRCRSNFPNFMDDGRNNWRSADHSWDEAAMEQFEAEAFCERLSTVRREAAAFWSNRFSTRFASEFLRDHSSC